MALGNFIPEIWSARLLKHLDEDLVFKQLVNTDYEGEIRNVGDTVRVNRIGDIVVGSYTKDGEIGSPQQLSGEQLVLTIDQFKYFNFYVDDVDSAQQNPKTMDDGLGKGVYPPDAVPYDGAPAHPNCMCFLTSVIDETGVS